MVNNMQIDDDGTINISDAKTYRTHISRLSESYTAPCAYCTKDCGPIYGRAECEKYQSWINQTEAGIIRKKMKRRRNGKKDFTGRDVGPTADGT